MKNNKEKGQEGSYINIELSHLYSSNKDDRVGNIYSKYSCNVISNLKIQNF